jgi:hypothetical protein
MTSNWTLVSEKPLVACIPFEQDLQLASSNFPDTYEVDYLVNELLVNLPPELVYPTDEDLAGEGGPSKAMAFEQIFHQELPHFHALAFALAVGTNHGGIAAEDGHEPVLSEGDQPKAPKNGGSIFLFHDAYYHKTLYMHFKDPEPPVEHYRDSDAFQFLQTDADVNGLVSLFSDSSDEGIFDIDDIFTDDESAADSDVSSNCKFVLIVKSSSGSNLTNCLFRRTLMAMAVLLWQVHCDS